MDLTVGGGGRRMGGRRMGGEAAFPPEGFGRADECLGAEVAGVVASPALQWH